MNKSKILILIILCVVCLLLVSCFVIYNKVFPKAPPIDVPDPYPDMTLVLISPDGTRNEHFIDGSLLTADGYLIFLMLLKNAKPTRIMSVNDHPDVSEYHTISYVCQNKTYTYYIYQVNGVTYAEIPYVGVYKLW